MSESNADACCPECGAQEADWNASRADPDSLRAQLENERAAHAIACQMRDEAEAKVGRLRKTLKEIAENTHDIEASACAWGALMNMKPRASEQRERQCPRCGSPDPARHPAVQFEGEVQICTDPFHGALGQGAVQTQKSSHPA